MALNLVNHSDLCSDSDEKPAEPTKIKCWTCSGCWKKTKRHGQPGTRDLEIKEKLDKSSFII